MTSTKTTWLMYDHCEAERAEDGTWTLLAYFAGELRPVAKDIADADIHERGLQFDHDRSMAHRVAMRPAVQFVPDYDPREMGIHPDR